MKDKVKQLYLEGYNEKEIFSILKSNLYVGIDFKVEIEKIEEYINEDLVKYKRSYKVTRSKRIKTLYANGYNYKEISKLIKENTNTIKSFIFRNCKSERISHLSNRRENKSIKKALDNTNNSYISNSSLLKQNRQAYSYNKNLNITFDETSNGVRTIDTPKTYYHK